MTSNKTDSIEVESPFGAFDKAAWNGLCAEPGPFVDWRFLACVEDSGCTGKETGWQPLAIGEERDGMLCAASPLWLKSHSHGEFVFDFVWAQAAHQNGMPWYPKLLVAAPFTPVQGPRLLGAETNPQAASRLVDRIESMVEAHGLSSAAVNFCDEHDAALLRAAGWLERFDWQYHWHNPGYADFEDFLARLRRKPRKNIRAERRRVRDEGWTFRWRDGGEIDEAELALVDRCYQTTFALYGNLPSLNREFFHLAAQRFGRQFLVCIARHDGQDLACAVFWRDSSRLYGRYWGSLVDTQDVHFEACYYQGIDYCIGNGLTGFEPGAQGEHKIRRGFLPHKTRSFHYIRHPGLREGVRRWLESEAEVLKRRREQLDTLDPFVETS